MNKKSLLTKVAVFSLFSTSLLSGNIANAQVSSEVDSLLGNMQDAQDIGEYLIRQNQELERFRIDCDYGDEQACTEYDEKVNAPDPEFDRRMRELEHQQNDSLLYGY
jgi:hypothetical protein